MFAWLAILAGLIAAGMLLSPWAVPLVLIASVIGVTLVAATQLRNDDQLEDKSLVELMTIALRSLVFLRNGSKSTQFALSSRRRVDRPPSKKGQSLVAVRDYVLQKAGREAWTSVLGALPGEDADTVSAAVDVGWYPLDLHARLLRAVGTRLGDGDLSTIPPIARFEAERDVPTLHHLLLQMGNPADPAEKISEPWPRDHSTGHLRIERKGDRALDATLVDWAADGAPCLAFQSYFQRAIELAGARDVRFAHTTCRARGAAECFFEVKWGAQDA